MKFKERALSILLSLVMVLTFMPALAFAEEGDEAGDFDGTSAVAEPAETSLEEAPEIKEGAKEALEGYESDTNQYWVGFMWFIRKDNDTMELYYYNDEAGSPAYSSTSLIITTYIDIGDGKYHTVTSIDKDALYGLSNLKTVTVPSTVTNIGSTALGYYTDSNGVVDTKVPGFTIIGTTGTAAQRYAIENGFTFRDPVAEAEAARQGTYDGKIPKVKISKPSTGKKSITVKWKKLTKKQLKKSKATKYEVWVCANTGFAMGETSEHIIKKSKSALKIKKVPKGVWYVKVRAIKYVGGVKMVGPWSKIKKVKVKK